MSYSSSFIFLCQIKSVENHYKGKTVFKYEIFEPIKLNHVYFGLC